MKDLLNRFEGIEGVRGVAIHDGTKIIESILSQDILPETADAMGRFIGRIETGGDATGISPKRITFYFNDLVLVSAHIKGDLALNMICTRKVNLPLLDVALNSFLSEFASADNRNRKVSIEDVMLGPLAFHIERIQAMLSEYLGPVALIILHEGIDKWIAQGPPGAGRLPQLITFLADEFEPAERAGFVSRVKGVLDKMV